MEIQYLTAKEAGFSEEEEKKMLHETDVFFDGFFAGKRQEHKEELIRRRNKLNREISKLKKVSPQVN